MNKEELQNTVPGSVKRRLGVFMVLAAGALWGTVGTVTKYIYAYGADPLTVGTLRILASFVLILCYALATGHRVKIGLNHLGYFAAFGLFSVATFNYSYLTAIHLTSVTTAVVLLYTAPAFSVLMARLFLNEPLNNLKILSLFLTMAGVILVVEAYRPGQVAVNLPGLLLGLASGFTFGLYSIFSKGAQLRGFKTLDMLVLALGFGSLFLLMMRPPWKMLYLASYPATFWLLMAVTTVISTMVPYILFICGVRFIEAGQATILSAVEPVVAVLLALLVLGEPITWIQGLGVLLILAAIRVQA